MQPEQERAIAEALGEVAKSRHLLDRLEVERRALVVEAYSAGATQAEIAQELGVTKQRVSQILRKDMK